MREILNRLLKKECSLEEAEKLLKANAIEEVGEIAKLDIFRKVRTGIVEVIYAENKTPEVTLEIIYSFLKKNRFAIVSRYRDELVPLISKEFKNSDLYSVDVNKLANILIIKEKTYRFEKKGGIVGIITAGSSDIPVAEEAKVIAESMGCEVISSYDLGIAGIHRLFSPLSEMIKKGIQVIIVCAGMEGTLPGVVAALVSIPVIGVPISSGYGLGEKGIGALTTMLQSCSPGLLVVNIDNGFGAGASAALIANKIAE
ncbi:MAG: nickel pincer cofactor biosynthesis protein LarB [Candidatus Lokiarchaeota archaeon]|nr:nickel pincer cofactor biosynthesis protein LarB [Candidatus Lokiarchaeota archaeon]